MYLIKKIVILIMTFSIYLSSSDSINDHVPNSKEAISIYTDKKKETIEIIFKLHKGVYAYKNKIKVKQEDLMKPFIILGEITFIKDNFFGTQPILEKDFILSFLILFPKMIFTWNIKGVSKTLFVIVKKKKKYLIKAHLLQKSLKLIS